MCAVSGHYAGYGKSWKMCIRDRVKGAAGQAVQNMNLMFGMDEAEGLNLVPMFP